MIHPYLVPNAVLQLLSGLVALLVSYYAFRYRRVARSSFLRLLSLGFMLLGLGLIAQGSVFALYVFNIGKIADRARLTYEVSALYLSLQIVAYVLIGVGYARRTSSAAPSETQPAGPTAAMAATVVPLLFRTAFFELSELIIIVVTAFIALQAFLVFSESKGRLSALVLTAFSVILLAHVMALLSALTSSGALYLAGGCVQLIGFLALLLFVARSGRVGTA